MTKFLEMPYLPWIVAVILLLALGLLYRAYRRRGGRLRQVLNDIAFDQIENLVIPNGDDGEILIDRLLLTPQGLLILEIKDIDGVVFGSDKMQDWTVIGASRRYTFSNPQPGLYDRIAAVREIVRQVPVAGRVLFLDGARFTKGMPGMVATLDDLEAEFGDSNGKSAQVKIDAFKPYWDVIRNKARSVATQELTLDSVERALAVTDPDISVEVRAVGFPDEPVERPWLTQTPILERSILEESDLNQIWEDYRKLTEPGEANFGTWAI